ncbi:hypothetical protein ACOTE7_23055 [Achromobacter xylosoxidans]
MGKKLGLEENLQTDPFTSLKMQVDVLFGLHAAQDAALIALSRTHPSPQKLLAEFDRQREIALSHQLGLERSDLAVLALDNYSAALRAAIAE